MREIKFRAWDEVRKKMYFPERLFCKKDGTVWHVDLGDTSRIIGQQGFELMQYTGLKDKNGTEIYEGDVIRDNDGFLWVVYFEDGMYCAKGGEYETVEYLIEFCPEWCEVVGNIFQDGDLLDSEISKVDRD